MNPNSKGTLPGMASAPSSATMGRAPNSPDGRAPGRSIAGFGGGSGSTAKMPHDPVGGSDGKYGAVAGFSGGVLPGKV